MSIADKLITVAENVPKVYEQGKVDQDKYFWDKYFIEEKTTKNYSYYFAGRGWNPGNFHPKHDMRPGTATRMFAAFNYNGWENPTGGFDLVARLDELGVVLDFSNCTTMERAFDGANIAHLGVIDLSKSTNNTGALGSKFLKKIDKVIVSANTTFSSTFSGASELKELTVEGTIAKSGFSVSASTKLDEASITSIINALSSTTSGLAVTLSKTAVDKAFETSDGANDGSTSTEWAALEAKKTDWTISLA